MLGESISWELATNRAAEFEIVDGEYSDLFILEGNVLTFIGEEPGVYDVIIIAFDEYGMMAEQEIILAVTPAPDLTDPVFLSSDIQTGVEGTPISWKLETDSDVTFEIIDGDVEAFSLDGDIITFTGGVAGVFIIRVRATEVGSGNATDQIISLTVVDESDPIFLSPNTYDTTEGVPVSWNLTTDSDVTFSIVGGASAASYTLTGSNITFNGGFAGTYTVIVRATEIGSGNTTDQTIVVTVHDESDPVFTSSNTQSGVDGDNISWTLTTDSDVTFSIVAGDNSNDFMLNGSVITFIGVGAGVYVVTVRATEAESGNTTDQTITLTVSEAPDLTDPIFTSSDTHEGVLGDTISWELTTDSDVMFSIIGGDVNAFSLNVSIISFIGSEAGTYTVTVRATEVDSENTTDQTITLTVSEPVIEPVVRQVASGQALDTSGLTTGDSLLLERGGEWTSQLSIQIDGLYVGAYGEGDRPKISGTTGTAIYIDAVDVTVEDVEVSGAVTNANTTRAVEFYRSDNLVLRRLLVHDTLGGDNIYGRWSDNVLIEECELYNPGPNAGDSIHLTECANPTIRGNYMHGDVTSGKGHLIVHAFEEGTTGGIIEDNFIDGDGNYAINAEQGGLIVRRNHIRGIRGYGAFWVSNEEFLPEYVLDQIEIYDNLVTGCASVFAGWLSKNNGFNFNIHNNAFWDNDTFSNWDNDTGAPLTGICEKNVLDLTPTPDLPTTDGFVITDNRFGRFVDGYGPSVMPDTLGEDIYESHDIVFDPTLNFYKIGGAVLSLSEFLAHENVDFVSDPTAAISTEGFLSNETHELSVYFPPGPVTVMGEGKIPAYVANLWNVLYGIRNIENEDTGTNVFRSGQNANPMQLRSDVYLNNVLTGSAASFYTLPAVGSIIRVGSAVNETGVRFYVNGTNPKTISTDGFVASPLGRLIIGDAHGGNTAWRGEVRRILVKFGYDHNMALRWL